MTYRGFSLAINKFLLELWVDTNLLEGAPRSFYELQHSPSLGVTVQCDFGHCILASFILWLRPLIACWVTFQQKILPATNVESHHLCRQCHCSPWRSLPMQWQHLTQLVLSCLITLVGSSAQWTFTAVVVRENKLLYNDRRIALLLHCGNNLFEVF